MMITIIIKTKENGTDNTITVFADEPHIALISISYPPEKVRLSSKHTRDSGDGDVTFMKLHLHKRIDTVNYWLIFHWQSLDFMYGCPIFTWVAMDWLKDWDTIVVIPVMADRVTCPISLFFFNCMCSKTVSARGRSHGQRDWVFTPSGGGDMEIQKAMLFYHLVTSNVCLRHR